MREIEIVLISPEICKEVKDEIMDALYIMGELIEGETKAHNYLGCLATFMVWGKNILLRWSKEDLHKYFSPDEIRVILTYRRYRRLWEEEGSRGVIRNIVHRLSEIDPDILLSIGKKIIQLELTRDCLGNLRQTSLFERELKKIEEYIEKFRRRLIKYETLRRNVRKYLKEIDYKIEDLTNILEGEEER